MNKQQDNNEVKILTLEQYYPIFITVDGRAHHGCLSPWLDSNRITSSPDVYMMAKTIKNGYLEDLNNTFYPLQNIISINWEKRMEKTVVDNFKHEYDVCFTDEEVSQMTEYTPAAMMMI